MKSCYTSLGAFAIIFIIVFSVYPELDIIVSKLFYNEKSNNFPMQQNIVSMGVYYSVRYFSILMFLVGAGCYLYDVLLKKLKFLKVFSSIRGLFKITSQQGLYLASVVFIIPYFAIHYIFKPLWGRARPFQINDFSGVHEFTPIYHFNPSWEFNSFPSGHTSMAFSIFALYFVLPEKIRPKVRVPLFLIAILGGLNRVIAGGHFLSDVIASAIITLVGVMILRKLILK